MSNATLAALGDRVRAVLKALSEDKKDEAPVPVPPPDPDALPADPRVEGADASPKDKDLDEAGEAQAAAPVEPPPGDEGKGSAPGGGAEDAEEGQDDQGRPVSNSFDEFGNADLDPDEMRAIMKSYGVTPPTDEDKLAHGGVDVESILEAILQGMESQTAELSALRKEVARLRSASAENERSIAKALDSLADPRTALAAPARAITKAITPDLTPGPTGETEAQFSTRLFQDVKAHRLSESDARVQMRSFKTAPR